MPFRDIAGVILIAAAALLSPTVLSDVVIVAPKNDYVLELAGKIKLNINSPTRITHSLNPDSKTELIVALGYDSLLATMGKTKIPVVGSFINTSDYSLELSSDLLTHVIYSDPAPEKLARFFIHNFQDAKIGFIYTQEEQHVVSELLAQFSKSSTQLIAIRHNDNTFLEIQSLTKKGIDIMFVSKNRSVYNPDNIRFVLESLFRKKIPVVTTSATLIEAGATIAITPTNEEIIEQTYRTVNKLLTNKHSVQHLPSYVSDVHVKVNPVMSDYFNIHIKSGSK